MDVRRKKYPNSVETSGHSDLRTLTALRSQPAKPLSRAVDASDLAQEAAKASADNKAQARSASEAAVSRANAALRQLEARVKVAEQAHVPSRELAPARTEIKDAQAALQKARTLLGAENYAAATEAVSGLEEQIRSEIRVVDAAITLRTARRPARKR